MDQRYAPTAAVPQHHPRLAPPPTSPRRVERAPTAVVPHHHPRLAPPPTSPRRVGRAPTATVKKQQKISPSLGISSVVIDIMKQSLHHLILINPLRIKSIDKLSMLRHLSLSKIEIHLS